MASGRTYRLLQILGRRAFTPAQWSVARERFGVVDTNSVRWFWPGIAPDGRWCFGVEDFGPAQWTHGQAAAPDGLPHFWDAVLFDPETPARWKLAYGLADWLGESAVTMRRFDPAADPLRLCADPLSWLRAVSRGEYPACWIGRGRFDIRKTFREDAPGPTLVCDNAAHAAVVYAALRAPLPPPPPSPPPPRVLFSKPGPMTIPNTTAATEGV